LGGARLIAADGVERRIASVDLGVPCPSCVLESAAILQAARWYVPVAAPLAVHRSRFGEGDGALRRRAGRAVGRRLAAWWSCG